MIASMTGMATAALGLSLVAKAPTGLPLFIERVPTAEEARSVYSGAVHEPKYGCFLGAYIDLDNRLQSTFTDSTGRQHRLPDEFERIVGKKHSSYFCYVGYGTRLPKQWITALAMEDRIVHIALEPNNGLEFVRDDHYLQSLADDLKDTGAKIFLRFASEMNGPWVRWHGDTALYRAKFRLVSRVMKERAPNVAMLWVPYTTPVGGTNLYYPGDDAVDWVGVNMYSVTYYNQNKRTPGDRVNPVTKLQRIYRDYAPRKPIVIGEYGATHYSAVEGKETVGFAVRSIRSLYAALPRLYPRVKAVHYFNGNNLELAHRQNNNYTVTQNAEVLQAYREAAAAEYYLSSATPRSLPSSPMPLKNDDTVSGTVKLSTWCPWQTSGVRLRWSFASKSFSVSSRDLDWETSWDTNTVPDGPGRLTVEAFQGQRRLATKSVRVVVSNPHRAQARIESPAASSPAKPTAK
ncbi:MAG: hypothetical protein KF884_11860 [Fimbriimonadaceae bacterium]|nr:hypothetical protein [Fimbriimonadaceae bacterium]QYK58238.1 MAG: hypothetical protein KF884_11860 [Fimbriimonadaceae bacterium]